MDVYTFEGILRDLQLGLRIVLVGPGRSLREAQLLLADALEEDGIPATVRWTNGKEEIRHESGGRVVFVRSALGLRGNSADVVVAFEPIADETRQNVWPALNASRRNRPRHGLPFVVTN